MGMLGVVGLLQMCVFWFDCVCVVIGGRVALESLMECVRVVGVVFEVWRWIMSCMPGVVLLGLGMGGIVWMRVWHGCQVVMVWESR